MKYIMIKESKEYQGRKIFRIKCTKSFDDVKEGDLGGFVMNKLNLSQEGNCWLYDNSMAMNSSRVYQNAKLKDNVIVDDNCRISEDALMIGNSVAGQDGWVYGNAVISGDSKILGYTSVCGDTKIRDEKLIDLYVENEIRKRINRD